MKWSPSSKCLYKKKRKQIILRPMKQSPSSKCLYTKKEHNIDNTKTYETMIFNACFTKRKLLRPKLNTSILKAFVQKFQRMQFRYNKFDTKLKLTFWLNIDLVTGFFQSRAFQSNSGPKVKTLILLSLFHSTDTALIRPKNI